MNTKGIDMNDPLFRYTIDEQRNMPLDEWLALLEESNEYVREKHRILQESHHEVPKFNTIEECMEYYNAIPLEDAINNWDSLFVDNDNNK